MDKHFDHASSIYYQANRMQLLEQFADYSLNSIDGAYGEVLHHILST